MKNKSILTEEQLIDLLDSSRDFLDRSEDQSITPTDKAVSEIAESFFVENIGETLNSDQTEIIKYYEKLLESSNSAEVTAFIENSLLPVLKGDREPRTHPEVLSNTFKYSNKYTPDWQEIPVKSPAPYTEKVTLLEEKDLLEIIKDENKIIEFDKKAPKQNKEGLEQHHQYHEHYLNIALNTSDIKLKEFLMNKLDGSWSEPPYIVSKNGTKDFFEEFIIKTYNEALETSNPELKELVERGIQASSGDSDDEMRGWNNTLTRLETAYNKRENSRKTVKELSEKESKNTSAVAPDAIKAGKTANESKELSPHKQNPKDNGGISR